MLEPIEEGFELRMSVSDTSVYTNIQDKATPTVGNMPVFRSYQSTNTLVLKDGQAASSRPPPIA